MKKIGMIFAAFMTICIAAAVGFFFGMHAKSATNSAELADESVYDEIPRENYVSACVFGLWSNPDLDPYQSAEYYLYDDLVPENAEGRLPIELHTQKYMYIIDAYEPAEQELGVAWLELKNATTGETKVFKYSPTSYARLRYSARSGEITPVGVEDVACLDEGEVNIKEEFRGTEYGKMLIYDGERFRP